MGVIFLLRPETMYNRNAVEDFYDRDGNYMYSLGYETSLYDIIINNNVVDLYRPPDTLPKCDLDKNKKIFGYKYGKGGANPKYREEIRKLNRLMKITSPYYDDLDAQDTYYTYKGTDIKYPYVKNGLIRKMTRFIIPDDTKQELSNLYNPFLVKSKL